VKNHSGSPHIKTSNSGDNFDKKTSFCQPVTSPSYSIISTEPICVAHTVRLIFFTSSL